MQFILTILIFLHIPWTTSILGPTQAEQVYVEDLFKKNSELGEQKAKVPGKCNKVGTQSKIQWYETEGRQHRDYSYKVEPMKFRCNPAEENHLFYTVFLCLLKQKRTRFNTGIHLMLPDVCNNNFWVVCRETSIQVFNFSLYRLVELSHPTGIWVTHTADFSHLVLVSLCRLSLTHTDHSPGNPDIQRTSTNYVFWHQIPKEKNHESIIIWHSNIMLINKLALFSTVFVFIFSTLLSLFLWFFALLFRHISFLITCCVCAFKILIKVHD